MRKQKDLFLNSFTVFCSSIGLIILLSIIIFVFKNGISTLNFKLFVTDYKENTYSVKLSDSYKLGGFENKENKAYFSNVWGIGLENVKNLEGHDVVAISYIADESPFSKLYNVGNNEEIVDSDKLVIAKIILTNAQDDYITAFSKDGAESVLEKIEQGTIIEDMVLVTGGGGIKGSLITTIYLIVLTLLFSLPLGVCAAIYLSEYAKKNKLTRIIRQMIDLTSGIPSIIFGFVGAIIFIPFVNKVSGSSGGSILSGALTLSIILLPIIIKTTEESIHVIPSSYKMASLSLGASNTQTTFKIILPSAIPGILTATLLSIGRIIGESAALIYAIGTYISDDIALNKASTSLAVHIWTLMAQDVPNFKLSCAISIIILVIVLLLSVTVKLLSKRINKMEVKR